MHIGTVMCMQIEHIFLFSMLMLTIVRPQMNASSWLSWENNGLFCLRITSKGQVWDSLHWWNQGHWTGTVCSTFYWGQARPPVCVTIDGLLLSGKVIELTLPFQLLFFFWFLSHYPAFIFFIFSLLSLFFLLLCVVKFHKKINPVGMFVTCLTCSTMLKLQKLVQK